MGAINFNAAEVEPQTEYQPIPAGTYDAVAVSSEMKATQSGGEMAVFRMQVIGGQYDGRTVFARFNVRNASPQAEQIGRSQLSAFCHAVGVLNLTDTDELLNKPVRIRLKVREAKNGYGPSNDVAGFDAPTVPPTPPTQPAARAAAPATRPAGAKPWQKAA